MMQIYGCRWWAQLLQYSSYGVGICHMYTMIHKPRSVMYVRSMLIWLNKALSKCENAEIYYDACGTKHSKGVRLMTFLETWLITIIVWHITVHELYSHTSSVSTCIVSLWDEQKTSNLLHITWTGYVQDNAYSTRRKQDKAHTIWPRNRMRKERHPRSHHRILSRLEQHQSRYSAKCNKHDTVTVDWISQLRTTIYDWLLNK